MEKYKNHIINLIKNKIHRKNPEAQIILYGSRARGDFNKYSDWDILILLNESIVDKKKEMEYREEIFDIELETGESISTFVFSKKDWENKYSITPLYDNIKKEGIHI
jgi:predicted nucleotidyltransferase